MSISRILWIVVMCSPFLTKDSFAGSNDIYVDSTEKVYVHLDNNWYFAGDTIWYAAYVVRADNHHPTDMSRILYVELLNEQGYLVERQQLVVDFDGRAHGQFALNESAWASYYEVRAYTKWMLNFGNDVLFSRVVPVYERPDSAEKYQRKVMPRKVTAGNYTIEYPLPKVSIRLYPEGGHLVYGLPSRVAFEFSDEETRRLNLSGMLLEDGRELQRIECLHAGRGVFRFTPRKGCLYKVRLELNDTVYEEGLGRIEERGSVMEVNTTDEGLSIVLRHIGRMRPERQQLLVSCRGRQEACFRVDTDDEECHYDLLADCLEHSGVHDITLTDSLGRILLQRKVFVFSQKEEKVPCHVAYDRRAIVPYGKIEMDVELGETAGEQQFSFSVTDKSQRDTSYYDGNILTELLLQSDIRGFVENAAWYFECPNDERRTALDLLLMVQGWSRYTWSSPRYKAEKSPSISGQMTDIHARIWQYVKGRKALFASLFLKNDSVFAPSLHEKTYLFHGAMYADSLDRFQIEYEPFTGEAILQLRGYYADKLGKRHYDKLLHDPHILIRLNNFFPDHLKQYSWYEMNHPLVGDSVFSDDNSYSIMLHEVIVNSRKRTYSKFRMEPVVSYDFNDLLNEYWDNGPYNKTYLFTNQYYDIERLVAFLEGKVMRRNFVGMLAKVGILADGNYIDRNTESYMDFLHQYAFLHRIDSVQIITDVPIRPTYYRLSFPVIHQMAGITAANVGYINFQKFPDKEERFVEGRYIKLHGFNRPVEFYSPDYSRMPLPEVPDHRHTLYWNPTVTTDAKGRAHVEFYNNSTCTEIDVEVEGITPDGKFITNE